MVDGTAWPYRQSYRYNPSLQDPARDVNKGATPVYVDDTTDDTTDTTDTTDSYGDDTTDTTGGHDHMVVEIDGQQYDAEENYDMDHDGANDTAVVETGDGTSVGFEDSDGDGTADIAVEYDENGDPIAAAEYDESTGEWESTDVNSLPDPVGGDGTDDGPSGDDGSNTTPDATDTGATTTDTSGSGGEDIHVDMQGGEVDAGPATYDTDGDGTNDTAVVADTDGTTYAFTDTDGDGEADQAVVISADGEVTVAEHTGDAEWTETEHGTIDAQGNYTPDSSSSSSSSDAAWA